MNRLSLFTGTHRQAEVFHIFNKKQERYWLNETKVNGESIEHHQWTES